MPDLTSGSDSNSQDSIVSFASSSCLGCLAVGIAVGWLLRSSSAGRGFGSLLTRLATGTRVKMVLVLRADVGMSRGKAASQAAHAAVSSYRAAGRYPELRSALRQWELLGQPKISLRVDSADELRQLEAEARRLGLPVAPVADAGHTEVAPGTATALGIGPAPEPDIDRVTGHLRLF
ncbi:hypothetical protein BOX15_Mlig033864g1 [Macrostomum lignano]|uniref:peptidyl-tRNA hydrolase n=1 Tax=Macrostomum lignano TaxID=282301 RepID=A0A267EK28_9PLAT|nr:hypothetical protein BOX15_Mlig033864g1 [Macrostomum lignano]